MKTIQKGKLRKGLSLTTMILSLLVGIMLALPFKVIHKESSEVPLSASRQELINRTSKLEQQNEQLRLELSQVRTIASSLEEAMLENEEASAELSEARTRYRILAGLDAVHGPGIRLTLSENTENLPPGTAVSPYIIHQQDLLNIVNELWLAGAEAISIRGANRTERLVLDSSIRCVGSLIDVNNTAMTPPFEINAIGNRDNLYGALTMPGGVLQPLTFFNIDYEIEQLDDIKLPAYGGASILEYAKPADEE